MLAMKTRHKVVLGITTLVVVVGVCLLVQRLADKSAERASALDAQYQEMTYAIVQGQAQEQSTNHPMNRLYRERRDALLKAGYLKTREFPLRHSFESPRASFAFLARFAARFPGIDRQLQSTKTGQPPVLVVCARDSDLVAIKLWVMQNDTAN